MRVLAACFVGFLGLGALATMAACSDSTDSGMAGAGGAPAAAGSGSGGKSGGTSTAGTGGGAECGFATEDCNNCLTDNCSDETNACAADSSCIDDLLSLPNCVCDPSNTASACIGKFVTDNGTLGQDLATCFNSNCTTACK